MSGILFDHEISTTTDNKGSFDFLNAILVTFKYSLKNKLWYRTIVFYSLVLMAEIVILTLFHKNYQNDPQELKNLQNLLFGWFLWVLYGETSRISLRVLKHSKKTYRSTFIHQLSYGTIIHVFVISLIWMLFIFTYLVLLFAILTLLSIFTIDLIFNFFILILLSLIFGVITNLIVLSIYLRSKKFTVDFLSPLIFLLTTFFSTAFLSLRDVENSMINSPYLVTMFEILNPLSRILAIARTRDLSINFYLIEVDLLYLIFLIIILIPSSYYSFRKSYSLAKAHQGVLYDE